MERTFTALAAAWCVTPLMTLAALYLHYRVSPSSGGSDHDIANSMLAMVIAVLVAAISFIATVALVRHYVPDHALRTVQILDGIGTAALLIAGFLAWRSILMYPVPEYPGYRAILDVEVRAPKQFLAENNKMGSIVLHFGKGEAREIGHNELIREEGNLAILPMEMEPSEHNGWSAVVLRNTDPKHGYWERYWFDLPIPDSPQAALPWSRWIKASRKSNWDFADDVAVRCRWVLVPQNEERVYRP